MGNPAYVPRFDWRYRWTEFSQYKDLDAEALATLDFGRIDQLLTDIAGLRITIRPIRYKPDTGGHMAYAYLSVPSAESKDDIRLTRAKGGLSDIVRSVETDLVERFLPIDGPSTKTGT